MRLSSIVFVTAFSAALFLQSEAKAQTCPGLPVLVGAWAFSTDGFNFPPTRFLASAGVFVASVGTDRAGNPIGLLAITQTTSLDGSPTRQENDFGRFQINADCTGGTLTFNVSSRPVQFDFFFVNTSEIRLIATNSADIVEGSAKRIIAAGCPANPLDALTGTWVFSSEGFQFPPTAFLAAAGRFIATPGLDRAGNPIGLLAITQTSARDGSTTRQEADAGRFQINSDCTGGTLTFNVSSRPIQFDFFFVSVNEIIFVGSNNADIVIGSARRFGT